MKIMKVYQFADKDSVDFPKASQSYGMINSKFPFKREFVSG